MAYYVIAETVTAANGSDTTLYEMPAGYSGVIGNIQAYNSSGGSLNFTLKLKRSGTAYTLDSLRSIGTLASQFYGKGLTVAVCPITMGPGDVITGQGSGAGIQISLSGLRFA